MNQKMLIVAAILILLAILFIIYENDRENLVGQAYLSIDTGDDTMRPPGECFDDCVRNCRNKYNRDRDEGNWDACVGQCYDGCPD